MSCDLQASRASDARSNAETAAPPVGASGFIRVPSLEGTSNNVTIDAEYYQRELGFWRSEALRSRAQIEQLVREKQSPILPRGETPTFVAPVEASVPSTTATPVATDEVRVERRGVQQRPLDEPKLGLSFVSQLVSDPTFERKFIRVLKLVAYLVVLVLFAYRTLLTIPFFLMLPLVGSGLVYFSGSILRSSSSHS